MALLLDNFANLGDTIVDYGHRPTLLQRALDIFIPLASVRIGRDLRSDANETVVTLDGAVLGDPMPVPADFAAIRSLWFNGQNGPHLVKSRSEITILCTPKNGAIPRFYMIRNKEITVRPFVASLYTLSYNTIPVLDGTTTVNAVLTEHPMLYLYAGLLELHTWTQDAEQRAGALQTYQTEIAVINRAESRKRASAPQAIGV
jgi:hypothetical protein